MVHAHTHGRARQRGGGPGGRAPRVGGRGQTDHRHRVRRRHPARAARLGPQPWTEEYQVDYLAMNQRVFDRIDAVVGEHVWNFADFAATTPGIMRVGGTRRASSPATVPPRPPRSLCVGGGVGRATDVVRGYGWTDGRRRCAWRSSSVPTRPRSTGSPRSWPGSAGWAWPSPAASTPRRCSRWRSARSARSRVVALLGVSPSLAADERAAAHDVARFVGVPVVEVETREGDRAAYRANGPDRCFHCKDELFTTHRRRGARPARARRGSPTARTPTTCARPDRPGAQAATGHGVLRPLADAGLDKAAVRRVARVLGLPCADKPAAPCLASRIPHHEPVTPEKLAQVEAGGTGAARRWASRDCRVRHHGDVARIELPADEIARGGRRPARRGAPRGRRGRVPVRGRRPRRDPVGRVHPPAGDVDA